MTVPQVIATLGTVFLFLSFLAILAILIYGWPGRRRGLSPETGTALKELLDDVEAVVEVSVHVEDGDFERADPVVLATSLRNLRVSYKRLEAHALEDLSS